MLDVVLFCGYVGGIESVFCIVFGDSLWFLYPKGTHGSIIPWYTLERHVIFWTMFVHALVGSFEF